MGSGFRKKIAKFVKIPPPTRLINNDCSLKSLSLCCREQRLHRTVIYGEIMIGNSWGFPNDKNTVVFNLYTRSFLFAIATAW